VIRAFALVWHKKKDLVSTGEVAVRGGKNGFHVPSKHPPYHQGGKALHPAKSEGAQGSKERGKRRSIRPGHVALDQKEPY